jgi:hypothetical protein
MTEEASATTFSLFTYDDDGGGYTQDYDYWIRTAASRFGAQFPDSSPERNEQ